MLIVLARASCRRIPSSYSRKLVLILIKDRSEDQRKVDGERVSLRFLSQSVKATQQKLWENTELVISEATFRKILLLSKHIKTYGKQNIKPACCRKCSEHSNFSGHSKSAVRKILKHVLKKMISLPFLIFPTLENRSVLQVTHPIISRADFERLCG